MDMAGSVGNDANTVNSGILYLSDPAGTGTYKSWFSSVAYTLSSAGRANQKHNGGDYRATTNAFDAIRIIPSSGNIVSGRFTLYRITHA